MSLNELLTPNPKPTMNINVNSIQIYEGAIDGYILTSDSSGSAQWTNPELIINPLITTTINTTISGGWENPLPIIIKLSTYENSKHIYMDITGTTASGPSTESLISIDTPLPIGWESEQNWCYPSPVLSNGRHIQGLCEIINQVPFFTLATGDKIPGGSDGATGISLHTIIYKKLGS